MNDGRPQINPDSTVRQKISAVYLLAKIVLFLVLSLGSIEVIVVAYQQF